MAADYWNEYLKGEHLQLPDMALAPGEPEDPKAWMELDPLFSVLRQIDRFDERWFDLAAWTYVAWRQLPRTYRYDARIERSLSAIGRQEVERYLPKIGSVAAVSIGSDTHLNSGYAPQICLNLHSSHFSTAEVVGYIPSEQVIRAAHIYSPSPIDPFPVKVVPYDDLFEMRRVGATPTQASPAPMANINALQSGGELFSQSPAGVLKSGTLGMFVDRPTHQDPCVLGAGHVLGPIGSVVLDSSRRQIGTVSLHDNVLDVSVVDLIAPWAVNYELPRLGLVPGPPVWPIVNMPVQMFGAVSKQQYGYITNTYYTAPSQSSLPICNKILTNINAVSGDSGALLCCGYDRLAALPSPYLHLYPQAYVDMHICGALGVLQGGANQGVGPIKGPTVFTHLPDILAALRLDPNTR